MLSPPIGSQICGAEVWGAVGGLHAARPRPANRMSGVQGFTETPSLRTPPRYGGTVKRWSSGPASATLGRIEPLVGPCCACGRIHGSEKTGYQTTCVIVP